MCHQALKQHYIGKEMTTRQTFDALDEDKSGYLDKEEITKAAGVLGAGLGFVMAEDELEKQWRLMDGDGDGQISFDEFEVWWKGVEAEQLVSEMDEADVAEALEEAGIETSSTSSIIAMREALKSHYSEQKLTPKAVFESLDLDGNGYLDESEIEKAAGMLGGVMGKVLSADELDECFQSMDPDGDGEVRSSASMLLRYNAG